MKALALVQPPRIVIGERAAEACVPDALRQGCRRIYIVTSPPVRTLADPIATAFRSNGAEAAIHEGISSEPTVGMAEEALAVARSFRPDAVAGLGGGSALDAAKLVAALAHETRPVGEFLGQDKLPPRRVRLMCLPTTSGTGSEVSPNAILLDEADQLKKAAISPYLVPDAAYVDPLLTLTVPPAVTAATGLDALTHCIEAFANTFAHPAVDIYALQGIRLIAAHLERAVRDGQDLEARAAMALGSFYGGLCLGPVNTAAVHALSYPLGGRFHIAHGVANSLLLPHVIRFNTPAAPERYAQVARALGVRQADSAIATAARGVDVLVQLSRACGVPQTLSELNIPRDALPEMARAAMQVTRLLKNNLRPVTEADAMAIYETAF